MGTPTGPPYVIISLEMECTMKKQCMIIMVCLQTTWSGFVWAEESKSTSFQEAYSNWTAYLANMPVEVMVRSSISSDIYYDNEPFRRILDLGVSAVPDIINALENDRRLVEALQGITKWKYNIARTGVTPKTYIWTVSEIPAIRGTNGPPDRVAVWKYWWQEERFKTGDHFSELYTAWKIAMKAGEYEKADHVRQKIINLGLPVLPYLVDVAKMQPEWMLVIRQLTQDALPKDISGTECEAWWKENRVKYDLPGKGVM